MLREFSHRVAMCCNMLGVDGSTLTIVKPRPNARSILTQHIAALLGATCCVRLATLLRLVLTSWVLLAQIFLATFLDVA